MIYFTPGPSQLYPTLKDHLSNAIKDDILSISHRSKKFMDFYEGAENNLRELLKIPKDYKVFFLSSSLESMERIIENCVYKKSLHFVNGSFSKTFYQIAKDLNKNSDIVEVASGKGFNFEKVIIDKEVELVVMTQNETSTGVMLPIKDLEKFAQKNKDKLFALDIVSSAPYPTINFEYFDTVFFSVQKGFGLPAGLGVLIVSPRALEKSEWITKKGISTGSYHSFSSLLKMSKNFQTPETPNVLNIYLLNKVSKDMIEKGIDKIRRETEEKSKMIYDLILKTKKLKSFVKEEKFKSKTTVVMEVEGGSKKLTESLKKEGFVVGTGYGEFKESHIRIANFPQHRIEDFKNLCNRLRVQLR